MIYEIRTYQLKAGSLAEVEKRFGEGYEYRKKYSPLAAFWHTEIGPLNEIVHVWPYRDVAERARVRAEAAEDPGVHPQDAVGGPGAVPVRAGAHAGQDGPGLRDALLHDQGRHAPGPDQALGVEDRRAHQALAGGAGRPRRVRSGQRLHPHLGVQEPRRARGHPDQGEGDRCVAAARRRRDAPDAGEQDLAARVVLAA